MKTYIIRAGANGPVKIGKAMMPMLAEYRRALGMPNRPPRDIFVQKGVA